MALSPPSSHGVAFTGAVLTLSGSVAAYVSAAVIPFDTAAYDSGGYFNAAGTKIVVPAGKAGWYRVGLAVQASFDPGTQSEFACKINTSGNPDDAIGVFTVVSTGSGIATVAYVLGPLAVGDDMRARVTWATGGGTVQLNYPAAQLTAQYLGPV
jgi:hypothetical protein